MPDRRHALTPDALAMMDTIARTGSFAAAARELGKVPSALTYSVRQLEDALDVLLFDRRSRQAKLTAAGEELLQEGRRLLAQMDAVANRVRRVATGWETQLTITADDVLSRRTLLELCEAFYAIRPQGGSEGTGTRLRLRAEVLAGTWDTLLSGQADLAIGVPFDMVLPSGFEMRSLGRVDFVFVMAPHHPLAGRDEPLTDAELLRHRAVAVADSAQRVSPITVNLLPGQDVLTVPTMQMKIDALLRCLGCGFVPEPMVRDHLALGHLVQREVRRARRETTLAYAWRSAAVGQPRQAPRGLALQWWLQQLESPATRQALLSLPSGLPCAESAAHGH
ncbi:LysR family transcriptional regulator [Ideonella dechloratans]|uniref:LysR family transcriptional regulator n=1 Tax=Ideonella dechloratans TaxID=36863 RepID=A0A643FB11_IDEDE|nr:LysR family transcriptional regulator [Ideonella dechloratans]KAB0577408.1 LysR family transcriptional regulator [Ideonella dechloratans]UFU11709.1 LysR family transcriptional regulator [Ideonella dechloratans]